MKKGDLMPVRWGLFVWSLLATPVLAEIYSWKDADGQVHFGDRPPAGQATEVVRPRISTIETAKIVPVKAVAATAGVVMYSAEWCGVCKRAKRYFTEHGVRYDERDIDLNDGHRADFEALGGHGVPLILVGSQRMDGFDAGLFETLRAAGGQ
jgi:glutaredoxin